MIAKQTISFEVDGSTAKSLLALYELLTVGPDTGVGDPDMCWDADLPDLFRYWIETMWDSSKASGADEIAPQTGWDEADRRFMEALHKADRAFFVKMGETCHEDQL